MFILTVILGCLPTVAVLRIERMLDKCIVCAVYIKDLGMCKDVILVENNGELPEATPVINQNQFDPQGRKSSCCCLSTRQ